MKYFRLKLWLGMTATPDKRDDEIEGKNIYEIFHYQIAYEIRLQQAMEENLLCPFHYFGITDVSLVDEKQVKAKKITEKDFHLLTSDERVRHIIEQASYYGYSGERVKGLVFCSRIDESEELSAKFNASGYRMIALNGSATEDERTNAFERLAMNEADATEEMQPLDYIFSVEILNGGVDTQLIGADRRAVLSARYMLQGRDSKNNSCRLFIENNAETGEGITYTRPKIVTDSSDLKWLEKEDLIGRIADEDGKLVIMIDKADGD